MTTPLTPGELARFGLDTGAIGAGESLAVPAPLVDEGRGPHRPARFAREAVGPPAADPAEPPDRPAERHVRSDALAALGIGALFNPDDRILSLTAPPELPFTMIELALAPARRPDNPLRDGTVRLPLRRAFRSVIATGSGVALVLLDYEPGTLRIHPLHAWPEPPLAEWLDGAMDETLGKQAETGPDRWTAIAMAGRLARAPISGSAARVAAWLAGEPTGAGTGPREWMRAFTDRQLDAVERVACGRAAALAPRLTGLLDALRPDAPNLAERWRACCHERDDLEGVRVLLREADAGAELEHQLAACDDAGRAIRFNWPPEVVVDDDQLQRAALSNPSAWWGSTAYEAHLL